MNPAPGTACSPGMPFAPRMGSSFNPGPSSATCLRWFPAPATSMSPTRSITGSAPPSPPWKPGSGWGSPREHVLLFFGYVRKYKGLDVLLDAIALLRGRLDLALLVVGEFYDDEQKYRDRIRRLELDHGDGTV
jgi:glycosyltransferase involved in cell wall biosynthesis